MSTTITPPSTRRRRAGALLLATAATVGVLGTAAPADARPAALVAYGVGEAAFTLDGAAYAGTLSGDPFGGAFDGVLATFDGALPELGECEPAAATLRVDQRHRHYALAAEGEVCAVLTAVTVYRFTGRWTVESTSVRRLAGLTGHLDVRVQGSLSEVYATT